MFNVDFKTFKEVLDKENILVWNEPDGTHVRLHGGDYDITMLISVAENTKKMYIVSGLDAFEDIIRRLEMEHKLTPGSYKLSYNKHFGEKKWDEVIQTDCNWHEAVRFFKSKSYIMRLDLKKIPGADSPSASAPVE
ncbi:hypothetical protein CTI12_AA133880 [Artemisia annua]|uniref:Uncharacterized protein n=1 Tax=Artemisia annua TaxID=35608 RepID=A0A2U1PND2_ARTAN|nr:hypothetical protein CTI12_AA133880 [Artemisia annua]